MNIKSTHHASALGELLLGLSLGYEWLDLVGGVFARVEVCPHHGLDNLGVIRHLGHDSVLHVLQSGGLHSGRYLGLLALRNTPKSNS